MLPKKDDKFDEVITHLRTTSLPEMASKYAKLRARVVDHQLNVFSGIAASEPKVQAGSSDTTLTAGPVIHDNSYMEDYPFTGDLMDDPFFGMVDGWEPSMEWQFDA